MSLFSLGTAIWGLHLRLKAAQAHWKEEAVMVRRRSMALSAAGAIGSQSTSIENALAGEKTRSRRWSEAADSYFPSGAPRASMLKEEEEEERLDNDIAMAKRNSREQDGMLRRAS